MFEHRNQPTYLIDENDFTVFFFLILFPCTINMLSRMKIPEYSSRNVNFFVVQPITTNCLANRKWSVRNL